LPPTPGRRVAARTDLQVFPLRDAALGHTLFPGRVTRAECFSMRIALSLAALLLGSSTAFADDIVIRADIAQATVFLSGAEVTRRGDVTIPAGTHRILIAMPDADMADLIAVQGPDGAVLGQPSRVANHPLRPGALDDAEQAAARATVIAAETALEAAVDALALFDVQIRAIEGQLAYLAALSDDGALAAGPASIPEVLAAIGGETERLAGALQTARIARRIPEQTVTDRQTDLDLARDRLAQLFPLEARVDMIALPVTADRPSQGTLTLHYFTQAASWAPSHELRLDTDSGAVSLAQFVTLTAGGGARWNDVTVAFSTADPQRPRDPSQTWPTPARVIDRAARQPLAGDMSMALGDMAAAPAATDPRAALAVDGLSVRFDYTRPVSIGASGTEVLALDPVRLPAVTEARGVPRHDATAHLVATVQNDTGAPILPGPARFFRDGALVGSDWLAPIAAGAKAELGFGPLDHLPLIWIDRSLAEGDRGFFTTSNTQSRAIAFGVENLSDRPERVRLVYATPFAEQEALTLRLSLAPEPDERDLNDQRGVHGWTLDLAPGARQLIEMQADFTWPEGQVLIWQP
jgi:uncharacterized protein (TIGR02231 family)